MLDVEFFEELLFLPCSEFVPFFLEFSGLPAVADEREDVGLGWVRFVVVTERMLKKPLDIMIEAICAWTFSKSLW